MQVGHKLCKGAYAFTPCACMRACITCIYNKIHMDGALLYLLEVLDANSSSFRQAKAVRLPDTDVTYDCHT